MGSQRVGFRDFDGFVQEFSAGIKKRAEQIARRRGRPLVFVPSGKASKEALVRKLLAEKPVKKGSICVLSCVRTAADFHGAARSGEAPVAIGPAPGAVLAFLLLFS